MNKKTVTINFEDLPEHFSMVYDMAMFAVDMAQCAHNMLGGIQNLIDHDVPHVEIGKIIDADIGIMNNKYAEMREMLKQCNIPDSPQKITETTKKE